MLHPDCGRHDTGWGHPEHQGRLPAIVDAIYRDTPDLLPHLLQHEGLPAAESDILRVHTKAHFERVRAVAKEAAEAGRPIVVNGDTAVSAASFDAALAAAGCALDGVRIVMEGRAATAFALTRPPGHHAPPDAIMGFCLFNSVAIAARALGAQYGLDRILVIDWDVHHGNGTQDIFWTDGGVFYFSLHQSPWYPGTGRAHEHGAGAGLGRTRNVPLPAGTTADAWLAAFRASLGEIGREFAPEFILVSAGFDCLAGDPLGQFLLEPADLHAATLDVLALARETAQGRVALVLEGGYAPKRVGAGVVDTFRALSGLAPKEPPAAD